MKGKILHNKWGQTAIELAAFGSIIIFIIGAIIRTVMSSGYQQNQTLKALRTAMSKSHLYSEGLIGGRGDGEASRNVGSVLMIEDRLTADSTKFGPVDRIPFIYASAASHSRNLFMPVNKASEYYHLPVFDVFVNGKHFPLTTSGFKTMCFDRDTTRCVCGDEWLNTTSADADFCGKTYKPHPGYWDDDCGSSGNSCPQFFTRLINGPREGRWCNDIPAGNPGATPCQAGNLTSQQRFDLDLGWTDVGGVADGDAEVPKIVTMIEPPPTTRMGRPRESFSWQWYAIYGWDRDKRNIGSFATGDVKGMVVKPDTRVNTEADFDADREEEQMIVILARRGPVISRALIMDSGEGDLDLTQLGKTGPDQVGLLAETSIETEIRPGTLLRIEEGKLFDASNQFVRSVQKRDHIDLITRRLKLTKDTRRYCQGAGKPFTTINENGNGVKDSFETETNPVDWCVNTDNECLTGTHSRETCMSLATNTIFIRSKPIDKRGRKWITNISQDDYVNYNVPSTQ